jgi:[ribosomal protein S5]-alanine N-acetyltransferase
MEKEMLVMQTQRLLLRPLIMEDRDAIFSLRSDSNNSRYVDRPLQTDPAQATAFIEKILSSPESYYWAVAIPGSNELVGTICLWNLSEDRKSAEIGYELLPAHQGKGFMQEAVARVIKFAEEVLMLDHIEAYTHRDNDSSTRLLQRFDFIRDNNRKGEHDDNLVIYLKKLGTA